MWIVNLANNQTFSASQIEWNCLPKYSIISMLYSLPNGKFLYLTGFEKYYQFKEIYQFLKGIKKNKIWTWNIFGKFGQEVFQFTHHIGKNKCFQIKNIWGKEYRPVIIKPKPSIILPNKRPQKQFDIVFGAFKSTNQSEWHSGVKLKTAIIKTI